jgi:hypothetical protein
MSSFILPLPDLVYYVHTTLQVISDVAATIAVIMGVKNSRKIDDVHVSINSRMDQLLEQAKLASHAQGVADATDVIPKH